MFGKWCLALVFVAFCAIPAATQPPASSDPYGLLPLLVDLPGWTAEPARYEDSPGQPVIAAAARVYRRGDAMLEISIGAGPGMAEMESRLTLPQGTDSRTVRTQGQTIQIEPINGFSAGTIVPDNDGEGVAFVVLSEGGMVPALLIMTFKMITLEEATASARRFDWAAMRTQLRAVH